MSRDPMMDDEPQREVVPPRVGKRRVPPSYSDDDDEEEEEEEYQVRIPMDDLNDPDWDEELEVRLFLDFLLTHQAMFHPDSAEMWPRHRTPARMIPVTAAFHADRYVFPRGGPHHRPPGHQRRRKPQYIPLFEDEDQARLLFTQSHVEVGFGP